MVTYELAKQLKDSGYPQDPLRIYFQNEILNTPKDVEQLSYPTLSELIEACGENLWTIRQGSYKGEDGWIVGQDTEGSLNPLDWKVFIFDPNLDVAVAKFWLALNKK